MSDNPASYDLRPPGVLTEDDFKARCVGCGQCAQVCNFDCILLESDSLTHVDTPRIKQQKAPCFLCMKCCDVCPTDALNNVPMHEAHMGKAKIDLQKCLHHQEDSGIMCWTCYERCPLKGKAIELQYGYLPRIIENACVGCGVCEYVCPIQAIETTPTRLLKKDFASQEDNGNLHE